ncbi:hypothetical protein [Niabella aurantiaca]|uniref:hypothetical protein n=1 Tax=Niabella aurantiaca TaxID=379900 RepID=UPI00037DB777|nr:hypothetical protein [Niabella aurantiaca]
MKKILIAAMFVLSTGLAVNAAGTHFQDKPVKTETAKVDHKKGKAVKHSKKKAGAAKKAVTKKEAKAK